MKKRIQLLALALLLITVSNTIKAQTTPEKNMIEFFRLYETSPEEAFDFLTRDMKVDKNANEKMKGQFLYNLSTSGPYVGHEKLIEKSNGNSLYMMSYMIKYETTPVRLTTVYYKPVDRWILFEYEFDGDLISELKAQRSSVE